MQALFGVQPGRKPSGVGGVARCFIGRRGNGLHARGDGTFVVVDGAGEAIHQSPRSDIVRIHEHGDEVVALAVGRRAALHASGNAVDSEGQLHYAGRVDLRRRVHFATTPRLAGRGLYPHGQVQSLEGLLGKEGATRLFGNGLNLWVEAGGRGCGGG